MRPVYTCLALLAFVAVCVHAAPRLGPSPEVSISCKCNSECAADSNICCYSRTDIRNRQRLG